MSRVLYWGLLLFGPLQETPPRTHRRRCKTREEAEKLRQKLQRKAAQGHTWKVARLGW